MKLLIVRHGDPDYTIDSLTPKGWKEVDYLSEKLAKLDVKAFYVSPASNLLAIHGSCGNEELLETGMQYIRKFLNRVDSHGQLQIIGPADETVSKIADMYRKVIYVKQEDHQLLLRAKGRLEQYIEVNSGFREIRIQLDFNH